MSAVESLWIQAQDVIQSCKSSAEARAVLDNLAKHCPAGNANQKSDVMVGLIQNLIQGQDSSSTLAENISAIESISVLTRDACVSYPVAYSSANRIFLAWYEADVVLRLQNDTLRTAFGHLVFLACVKCIHDLSLEVPYNVIPLHQLTPTKKGATAWTTPYAQIVKYDDSGIDVSDRKRLREGALDIKKMFHCIYMIELFATTGLISQWISLYRQCKRQEQIILAQICLLSNNVDSAVEVISRDFIYCHRGRFLNGAIKLCQNDFINALESIIQTVRDNEEEFCENALRPADGISDCFLGGSFEFTSRRSLMLDCVRVIMACASANSFPITARIALCQYAWPTMEYEFKKLVADHVTDNRLFEFEQFREQILHSELVDTFLALHRAGKLHMKLGAPQVKQSGRMLRGVTRNLSITTEKDLEDHIVNCGNHFQSLGTVLFNLITNDLYSLCCDNRSR